MKILGSLILVALAALAVFAAVNWHALSSPIALSFLVARAEAPLGLILIGFALGFALLLAAYVAAQRATLLVEARRHAEEVRALRALAEQAEASRLAELRRHLDEAVNGLAAHLGQIDDKLDRLVKREAP